MTLYSQTVPAKTLTAAVAAEIIAARKSKGWTQADLADAAGKTRVSVQRWESGGSIKIEDLADLAVALGEDPGLLFARAAALVHRED